MPVVRIRTGVMDATGRETVLTEYLCDWPNCPNAAEHVVGAVREMSAVVAFCREHATGLTDRTALPGPR